MAKYVVEQRTLEVSEQVYPLKGALEYCWEGKLIPGRTSFAFRAQFLKYFLSIRLPPMNSFNEVASVESNLIVESRQG